jgi:hypothetical protein
MNWSDEQLKHKILSQPTPPMSPDFVHRTWLRLQREPMMQTQAQVAWAGGFKPASPQRSHLSSWLVSLMMALAVAGWSAQHMWQNHADEELYRLDPVGMSSLLTL